MRMLPCPSVNNQDVYKSILESKPNTCSDKDACSKYKKNPDDCKYNSCPICNKSPKVIMRNYEKDVLQQYDEYLNKAPNFEEMLPNKKFGADLEKELRNGYKSNAFTGTRTKIFNHYKSNGYGKCPFCRFSGTNTLDHYLSESLYPQFIVFAPNLVPCCSDCNNKKGTSLLNEDKKRIYFHYYYDDLPEDPILECEIFLKKGVPEFKYYVEKSIHGKEADIYRRQTEKLDLIRRYDDGCTEDFSTLIIELKDCYKLDGITECERVLKRRLKAESKSSGVNHYKTAMLRGFLKDIDNLETMLKAL